MNELVDKNKVMQILHNVCDRYNHGAEVHKALREAETSVNGLVTHTIPESIWDVLKAVDEWAQARREGRETWLERFNLLKAQRKWEEEAASLGVEENEFMTSDEWEQWVPPLKPEVPETVREVLQVLNPLMVWNREDAAPGSLQDAVWRWRDAGRPGLGELRKRGTRIDESTQSSGDQVNEFEDEESLDDQIEELAWKVYSLDTEIKASKLRERQISEILKSIIIHLPVDVHLKARLSHKVTFNTPNDPTKH